MYLPLTPPPKREYGEPGSGVDYRPIASLVPVLRYNLASHLRRSTCPRWDAPLVCKQRIEVIRRSHESRLLDDLGRVDRSLFHWREFGHSNGSRTRTGGGGGSSSRCRSASTAGLGADRQILAMGVDHGNGKLSKLDLECGR